MQDKMYTDFNFGILPKGVMRDINLSIQAKAIYAYLCAYAGNKGSAFPSVELIKYELNISKDTFYKYIKELENTGYIVKEKERATGGQFKRNIYYLRSLPCPKNPDMVKPDTVLPDTDFQDTNNNSINNNNLNNNKLNNSVKWDKIQSKYFETYKRMIPTSKIPLIQSYIDDGMEEELILYAFDLSIKAKAKHFNYTKSILNTWTDKELMTLKSVKDNEEKEGNRKVASALEALQGLKLEG